MAELRLTLATLVRVFEFRLTSESQTLTPHTVIFTQPKENSFPLRVTPRTS
ncbi:hypothetical protein DSO57_1007807 [Entomophthora muscae]|uniref:Uncharacterized protein n=1 Tax=Entomophthora muscae TaxID=34485 RepID=A0ACC2S8Z8_9FUNG|nr:hypothetical protein DSO57_1007807 [Entomophthora muscae]